MFTKKIVFLLFVIMANAFGSVQLILDSLETENVKIISPTEVDVQPYYFAGIVDGNIMLVPWDTILAHIPGLSVTPAQNKLVYVNPSGGIDTSNIQYDPSGMTLFPSRINLSPDEPTFRHFGVNTDTDGYDTSSVSISGANSATRNRAGHANFYGEDHDSTGMVEIISGYSGGIKLKSSRIDFDFGDKRAFKITPMPENGVDLGCYIGYDTVHLFSGSNQKAIHLFDKKVLLEDTIILNGVTRGDSAHYRTTVASGPIYSEENSVSVQDQIDGKQDTSYRVFEGITNPMIYRYDSFSPNLAPSLTLTQGAWYNDFSGTAFFIIKRVGALSKWVFYQDDPILLPDPTVHAIYQGLGELVISHSGINEVHDGNLYNDTVDARIKIDSFVVNGYIKSKNNPDTTFYDSLYEGTTYKNVRVVAKIRVSDSVITLTQPLMTAAFTGGQYSIRIAGIPDKFLPSASKYIPATFSEGGTVRVGYVKFYPSLNFYKSDGTAFASGTHGIVSTDISWTK